MLAAAAMGMAIGLSFVWTFAVFTATSWTAFPRFVVATVFLFLLPGWQIVRLCRLQLSTVERVTLSAVLGIVSTCFVYAVLAWLGVPSLLYWWIIAALIGLGWTWRSASMDIRDKFLTVGPAHLFLFLALIVSWIPMYVLPFYYKNLSLTGIGGLTFAPVVPDVLFHTALASELTHAFPPQIPFISGEPLSYHVGMDLVAAVLNRFGGVPIADLVVRYCPTLFITIDILAVFCLAHRVIGSRGAAVVAAMLATLGEDLSFIPGLLQNSDQLWIVHYFAAPTIVSLYYVNPMVMAHGLLFTSLFCLQRSIADPRWGWAIAVALCCAALVQTKVFVFVQLFAAVGIAVAINLAVFRRWVFLKEWLAIALISAPLVFYTALGDISYCRPDRLSRPDVWLPNRRDWRTDQVFSPIENTQHSPPACCLRDPGSDFDADNEAGPPRCSRRLQQRDLVHCWEQICRHRFRRDGSREVVGQVRLDRPRAHDCGDGGRYLCVDHPVFGQVIIRESR